ncbi:hypothetical protein PVAP13_3KG481403 [Panicum virgatum]|uniref:Uncharacterized protein n=1 Tax=Panicum virgatum TaxID=38727 RepID=A0A8T0VAD2_PANVG|nr:hypothetical protein PVAP13_3KG481403 [Panicum virgatum]
MIVLASPFLLLNNPVREFHCGRISEHILLKLLAFFEQGKHGGFIQRRSMVGDIFASLFWYLICFNFGISKSMVDTKWKRKGPTNLEVTL